MSSQKGAEGFVYILEVKDIDLPVCKIGHTVRDPAVRCAEINQSSTGDFLWKVAFKIAVNDCNLFERLVHRKLQPLRQKNREFFNVDAETAWKALVSILDSQSEFQKLDDFKPDGSIDFGDQSSPSRTRKRSRPHPQRDSEYAQLLASFTRVIGCKGRPFGQLSRPSFGISDGVEGVQWNLAINTERDEIRFGVNLEGMAYEGWPIARFLKRELAEPKLFEITASSKGVENVYLNLTRDAWQVTSRPMIIEENIGGKDTPISKISAEIWVEMLEEALDCLNAESGHRGRSQQTVTLRKPPKNGPRERVMPVSPHLTIWTPVSSSDAEEAEIETVRNRLLPIYKWVKRQSA